jgi:hypothetical protein
MTFNPYKKFCRACQNVNDPCYKIENPCFGIEHTVNEHIVYLYKTDFTFSKTKLSNDQKLVYYVEPPKEVCTKCLKSNHESKYCELYHSTIHNGYDHFYKEIENKELYNELKNSEHYLKRINKFKL